MLINLCITVLHSEMAWENKILFMQFNLKSVKLLNITRNQSRTFERVLCTKRFAPLFFSILRYASGVLEFLFNLLLQFFHRFCAHSFTAKEPRAVLHAISVSIYFIIQNRMQNQIQYTRCVCYALLYYYYLSFADIIYCWCITMQW